MRLWLWSRTIGWRAVHAVNAGRRAPGCAGLAQRAAARSREGRPSVTAGIPLNLVQKWLGHAQNSARTMPGLSVSGGERQYDVQAAKRQANERRKTQEIAWPVGRAGVSARLMAQALDSMGNRVAQPKFGLYGEPEPLSARNSSPESLDYVGGLLDSMGSNGEQPTICYQLVR
jgi:hypothetical protein